MSKEFYFEDKHFEGYFTWTSEFSSKLDLQFFHHSCHEEDFKKFVDARELTLRSQWNIDHPLKKHLNIPGVWTMLDEYPDNFFGPFQISLNKDRLINKRFMVFINQDTYFFVQHQSPIPVFIKGDSDLCGEDFFYKKSNNRLGKNYDKKYRILLTDPIKFKTSAKFSTNNHSSITCIKKTKCQGCTAYEADKKIYDLFKNDIDYIVYYNPTLVEESYSRKLTELVIYDWVTINIIIS